MWLDFHRIPNLSDWPPRYARNSDRPSHKDGIVPPSVLELLLYNSFAHAMIGMCKVKSFVASQESCRTHLIVISGGQNGRSS